MGPQALYIHKHQEQQLSTDQVTSSSSNERVRTLEDLTHWGRRVWLEPGRSVGGVMEVGVVVEGVAVEGAAVVGVVVEGVWQWRVWQWRVWQWRVRQWWV